MTLVWRPGYTWWDPSLITTALWLDAADASTITASSGAVSQWNDKSGNGFHATQPSSGNRPTTGASSLSGKNVITFSSPSFFSCTPTSYTSDDFTLYVVFRANNYNAVYPNDAGLFSSSTAGTNLMYAGSSAVGFAKAGTISLAAQAIASAGPHIAAFGRSGANAFAWANGSTPAFIANYQTPSVSTSINIGRYGAAPAMYLNGFIGEMILINSYDAASNNSKVTGYLAHKWGLTANLPSNHPYKTNAPAP